MELSARKVRVIKLSRLFIIVVQSLLILRKSSKMKQSLHKAKNTFRKCILAYIWILLTSFQNLVYANPEIVNLKSKQEQKVENMCYMNADLDRIKQVIYNDITIPHVSVPTGAAYNNFDRVYHPDSPLGYWVELIMLTIFGILLFGSKIGFALGVVVVVIGTALAVIGPIMSLVGYYTHNPALMLIGDILAYIGMGLDILSGIDGIASMLCEFSKAEESLEEMGKAAARAIS